jgi:pimeloyl-ACP methyl ester carboxylesterase
MATLVIVHGGWGGGWEWRDVERLLRADGHEVSRVTLTGLGERAHLLSTSVNLDTHVEDVVRHIQAEDLHGVILVGHSYGGMVVTGVADRVPERIAGLVYVDAFVPRDGESLLDLLPDDFAGHVRASAVDGRVPPPGEDPRYPRWYLDRVGDHPLAAFEQPLRRDRHDNGVAATYIKCTESDVPLDSSVDRAKTAGWTMRELATGHDAQVFDPDGLAELLRAAAAASS